MKIKVCGMKHSDNIKEIQNCLPDFIGFIFYEKSPRYINSSIKSFIVSSNKKTKRVGVFVNSAIEKVLDIVSKYELDFVQLHGNESVEYVKQLSTKIKVIKAFRVYESFNWDTVGDYTPYVNYFLFDTATKNYGGGGKKFNWDLLKKYKSNTPFFLSGGITINDVSIIKELNVPQLYAIDINSKFETEPGVKEAKLVKEMIKKIRNEK